MRQKRTSRLTSMNYANRGVENNSVLISNFYSDGKEEWEKDCSQIIIKVGRAFIPRVNLREDQFVLACPFKWKFKCELKNDMLSLKNGFFPLCQRAVIDRGQHVIDFEAPMCILYPMVNSKQFKAVYDRNFVNNINKQIVYMAAHLT